MTDRPIIFSGPMVRALLDGRKTQTRRLLKGDAPKCPPACCGTMPCRICSVDPRFAPGDRLWVRENFQVAQVNRFCDSLGWADHICIDYPAAHGLSFDHFRQWKTRRRPAEDTLERQNTQDGSPKVSPSIHMPRWVSRITLHVTGVKVERLQDISEADAIAEGIEHEPVHGWRCYLPEPSQQTHWTLARESFRTLWQSINGAESWAANPWVVAVTFKVVRANIDSPEARAA